MTATTIRVPCWSGLGGDHLYANCPARVRSEATLRSFGWWFKCDGLVDPHGTDICGLCVHRYDRTASPTPEEERG